MNSSVALSVGEIKELDNKVALLRKQLFDYLNANVPISSDLYKKISKVVDEFLRVADRYRLGRIECQKNFAKYNNKNPLTIHLENLDKLERNLERDGQIEDALKVKGVGDELRKKAIRSLVIDEYLFKWMTNRVSHLLLRDLLVICNSYKLPVAFSYQFDDLDSSGAFFVFKEVFEFCEFGSPFFRWKKYVKSRAFDLDGLLLSRIRKINESPLREPMFVDKNGFGIFEVVGREYGDIVDNRPYDYPGRDDLVIRGILPNFAPWKI